MGKILRVPIRLKKPGQKPAIMNWSGGKDSALCLHKALALGKYDIRYLLTTMSEENQRIDMHGISTGLIERQAASIGISLLKVALPEMPPMKVYEKKMMEINKKLKNEGIKHTIFGDIFLEDLRKYRMRQAELSKMQPVFPLWNTPSNKLYDYLLELNFKALVICTDDRSLDKSFLGRELDESFRRDLPKGVNICGENGEFHTFVYDGPIFSEPVEFEKGEVTHRTFPEPKNKRKETGFHFLELLPA